MNNDTSIKSVFQEIHKHLEILNQKFGPLKVIYCGDYNVQVGSQNSYGTHSGIFKDLNFCNQRSSLDCVMNEGGRILLDLMENEGCYLLNGHSSSDSSANFTFSSILGNSVIGLVWANQDVLEYVQDLRVCNDFVSSSDHFPVEILLRFPIWQPPRKAQF